MKTKLLTLLCALGLSFTLACGGSGAPSTDQQIDVLSSLSQGEGPSLASQSASSSEIETFVSNILSTLVSVHFELFEQALEVSNFDDTATSISINENGLNINGSFGSASGNVSVSGKQTGENSGKLKYSVDASLNHYGYNSSIQLTGSSSMDVSGTLTGSESGSISQTLEGTLSVSGNYGAKISLYLEGDGELVEGNFPVTGQITLVSGEQTYSCQINDSVEEIDYGQVTCQEI